MTDPHVPPAGQAPPAAPEPRRQRADGAEARQQLLGAALRLFADRGFDKTSTRDIAQAAGANIAAISYYFGDKAGLYRAVFREPMGLPCDDIALCLPAGLPLRQSLEAFIDRFLDPLKQGDFAQQITRLHFREMLEPTGLWAEQIDLHIRPAHAALVKVLARHLKAREDDDLHRLAFSIAGLAMQIFITREVIDSVRPRLLATSAAIDTWGQRLADQAEAMVAVEAARRRARADARSAKAGTARTFPVAAAGDGNPPPAVASPMAAVPTGHPARVRSTASPASPSSLSSSPSPARPRRRSTASAAAADAAQPATPTARPRTPSNATHDRKPAKN